MANLYYEILPAVFNMSVTASIAAVIILIFRFLCQNIKLLRGRISNSIFYALWFVVLFRLLCPFSISADISLFSQFKSPVASVNSNMSVLEYIPVDIVHTEYPAVDFPVDFADHLINFYLPKGKEQLVADPLEAPMAIATNIWLCGIFAMGLYGIASYIRLMKQLSVHLRIKDNIYICDNISSPFVTGILNPKIFLPSELSMEESEYIVLHEQYHIKRFDHIFKLLAFAALTLHWFNPVVWLAFKLAMQDMEMSCDEAVIKTLGEDVKGHYSLSLLNLSTEKHIFAGTPLAFGEGDTSVRIKNLYNLKRKSVLYSLTAILFATILGAVLLINPKTNKAVIIYNGMEYQQTGNPDNSLPNGCTHIENLLYTEEWYFENHFELCSKNIPDIYRNMPIFQQKDNPETIYLTCGSDGWMPLKADSMDYKKTNIWIEPKQIGKGVEYTVQLNSDVKECGIVEDIYMQGKLHSSRLVSYCDSVQNLENYRYTEYIDYEVRSSNDYNAFDEMDFIIKDNGVTATCPVALPREGYTGCGSYPPFRIRNTKNPHHKLLANDSYELLIIAFSTMENGGIYADFTGEYSSSEADRFNDTVIIYRFVTSSRSLRN